MDALPCNVLSTSSTSEAVPGKKPWPDMRRRARGEGTAPLRPGGARKTRRSSPHAEFSCAHHHRRGAVGAIDKGLGGLTQERVAS